MELVALKYIAAGIGAGLTVIGAGLGLGKIGTAALEGTARQPEAGGAVRQINMAYYSAEGYSF